MTEMKLIPPKAHFDEVLTLQEQHKELANVNDLFINTEDSTILAQV